MSDETWNLPSRNKSSHNHPKEDARGCLVQPEQSSSGALHGRSANERLCLTDLPASLPILADEIALLEMWLGGALTALLEQ